MKAFKAFVKYFKAAQSSVQIKISVDFFSSLWIVMGRVNNVSLDFSAWQNYTEIVSESPKALK